MFVAAVGALVEFFLKLFKEPVFDGRCGVCADAIVYKETDDAKVVVLCAPEAENAGVDCALCEAE